MSPAEVVCIFTKSLGMIYVPQLLNIPPPPQKKNSCLLFRMGFFLATTFSPYLIFVDDVVMYSCFIRKKIQY